MKLISGDCIEAMRDLPDESVDAIVTDPPYGINFMGKAWDGKAIAEAAKNAGGDHHKSRERSASMHAGSYDLSPSANQAFQLWCQQWAEECLRVLKPGGHLLSFSGSRTYHRLACAVEDAGFEVRDQMMWLYGSGFPKSLDVSKAIDKAAGAERQVVGKRREVATRIYDLGAGKRLPNEIDVTAPATAAAAAGWGTALKPAHEPIVMARKPLAGTVAENVLRFGTGALNIDSCRIGIAPGDEPSAGHRTATFGTQETVSGGDGSGGWKAAEGRWPANVVMDEEAGRLLDEQSGTLTPATSRSKRADRTFAPGTDRQTGSADLEPDAVYADTGGASRFFYCAKASKGERNAGLDGFEERKTRGNYGDGIQDNRPHTRNGYTYEATTKNVHPTVKPISLMRYLVRLVTPPEGTVLDPFLGSGTTGCAAVLEGFDFIGIEREAEYLAIAEARIAWWDKHRGEGETDEILKAAGVRDEIESSGQLGLLEDAA